MHILTSTSLAGSGSSLGTVIVSNWEKAIWISVVLCLLVGAYALILVHNEFHVSYQTFHTPVSWH